MAGMLNIGHHMNGMQVAGLLNINADYKSGMRNIRGFLKDTVEGVSIAGLMNVNAGYMNGVRLGGIANIGNSIDGVQVAGLFNANAGAVTEGVQLAGLFNANAEGITEGVELAGLFNINRKHMNGFQLGGLFNVTGESSDGVQLAGLFNVTIKEISGLQLSGLFNYAREMDGVQIGLINVSGGEDVFPVGLLSFSRNGYHKLELYGDEIIQTQMAFRTGVQHFHNIFSAGVDLTTRFDGLWCFGYGLGSYFNINEKWLIGGDAALQLLMDGKPLKDNYKLYSGFIGVERKFGKNFSMALGPSLKLMDADQLFMNKIVPYSMYETLSQDGISGLRMWVGGKVALRFF